MNAGNSHRRAIRLIQEAIQQLQLDLKDRRVLTEVGSGGYLYTPIIPALAGARQIMAWTSDSRYGKGADIRSQCLELAQSLGVDGAIEISVNEKPKEHIAQADIITNSGFLRPLDKNFLQYAKHGAVVPLMYEAWELRAQDIDIEFCKSSGILVAGTWENHPKIGVFDSAGALAVKLAHEAGFEVYQNNIVIWSSDSFGEVSSKGFLDAGASSVKVHHEISKAFINDFRKADFIYLCDYHEQRPFFGLKSVFDLQELKKLNDSFAVIHLYGDVDNKWLGEQGIGVYPDRKGSTHQMTFTLGHLGLKPIINLQVAGFKVAEEMLEGTLSNLSQPISF